MNAEYQKKLLDYVQALREKGLSGKEIVAEITKKPEKSTLRSLSGLSQEDLLCKCNGPEMESTH